MWIQVVLILNLIKSSKEECNKLFDGGLPNIHIYTLCTNITPENDLRSQFLPNVDYSSIEDLFVVNSSIPELTQKMFRGVSFYNITIRANVEVIQNEVFKHTNVTSVVLDNNDIKILMDMSFTSSKIRFLSLQNNSLSKIKVNNFQGLPRLEKLNLKYNSIRDIEQGSFKTLMNLEELDLSFNKLAELHFGEFQDTTRLQTIYLNNNLLKTLSDDIFSQCKTLKYLNIANNFLTIIDARNYPSSLVFINTSNNLLTSVNFSNLVNVNTINLNFNNLKSVTDSLYNLTSLKYLYLSNNRLDPSMDTNAFHHLKNLSVLDLDSNNLHKIDFVMLNNLPHLQNVSLAANNWTNLDFFNLNASLMTLILRKNSLKEITNLSKIHNLRKLDLSYNNLKKIRYNTFENMTNLIQLWLQHNAIRFLQLGCFRSLYNLRELNLSHNKITIFEMGIFAGLNRLITLDVSYNNLSHLDEHIFHNTDILTTLNISYNYLSDIDFKSIRSHAYFLRNIDLTGNNWTCKSLINNFHTFHLNRGKSYNVTNVFGIPCDNTNIDGNRQSNKNDDLIKYLNYIEGYEKQISSRITIIAVLLTALLVLFCVKFTFSKRSSYCARTRQLVRERYRNHLEIPTTTNDINI